MSKLKVYGGCYDGKNRVIVAAKNKKSAHAAVDAAIGISYYGWDMYTAETGNEKELFLALSSPGVVFSAPNNYHSEYEPVSK